MRYARRTILTGDLNVDVYAGLPSHYQRFVDEFLVDLNATAAAVRSGLAASSAQDIFNRPEIQVSIEQRRRFIDDQRASGPGGARYVLSKLWDIATADPREIVAIHKVPCRYCWGTNGAYQFTRSEMDRNLKAYEYGRAGRPFAAMWPRGAAEAAYYELGKSGMPFDAGGGDGYTTTGDPNPDCSECSGQGVVVQYICDTRKLSPQARQLYRGLRTSQKGIEILMASQENARDMLARHYGVAVDRKELVVRSFDPTSLSDEELAAAIAELEAITLQRGSEVTVVEHEPQPARARLRITRPAE